jgi:hypothetical protein
MERMICTKARLGSRRCLSILADLRFRLWSPEVRFPRAENVVGLRTELNYPWFYHGLTYGGLF